MYLYLIFSLEIFVFPAPVVVTSTTHTVPGPGYPQNSTIIATPYPVHGYIELTITKFLMSNSSFI